MQPNKTSDLSKDYFRLQVHPRVMAKGYQYTQQKTTFKIKKINSKDISTMRQEDSKKSSSSKLMCY